MLIHRAEYDLYAAPKSHEIWYRLFSQIPILHKVPCSMMHFNFVPEEVGMIFLLVYARLLVGIYHGQCVVPSVEKTFSLESRHKLFQKVHS